MEKFTTTVNLANTDNPDVHNIRSVCTQYAKHYAKAKKPQIDIHLTVVEHLERSVLLSSSGSVVRQK